MKVRSYGDRGVLLVELTDTIRCRLLAQLDADLPVGCQEFVVGYESILLLGSSLSEIELWLTAISHKQLTVTNKPKLHDIEVNYNGADLEYVAKATGMDVVEVIQLHCAPIYTVRMMGFSPGFPYLDGLDARLHLDRRASPRNRIEPGTVAIGGTHAGIYSVASPGGWHLIGQTDLPLFDLDAAQDANPEPANVFVLAVGDQVRFHPKKVRK